MRYGNLFRFLTLTFVIGSLLGLSAGLVSGGNAASPSSGEQQGLSEESNTATQKDRLTPEKARIIAANELGQVMVLEYHRIGTVEEEWTRTPDGLREDIQLLKQAGYFPVNTRDLVSGEIDVPAGKTPVALTFDDSSPGQYRILDEGSVDPDSAVGIIQTASREGDWPTRASFYCLIEVLPDDNVLFGQPDRQRVKLSNLVTWGFEIGSHTVTHLNLAKASEEEIRKQLTVSKSTLEEMANDRYVVNTISVPFGEYPEDISILESGTWEDNGYQYLGALEVAGGPSASPFSTSFNPMHISRIQAGEGVVKKWIKYFEDNPGLRYVSDGDLLTVSVPVQPHTDLGDLSPGLGRPVMTY